MTKLLKTLSSILLVLGIIGSFFVRGFGGEFDLSLTCNGILSSVLSFALLQSVAYGLELLESIRDRLAKMPAGHGAAAPASQSGFSQSSVGGQKPLDGAAVTGGLPKHFVVCRSCGLENSVGKLFCIGCGERLQQKRDVVS